MTRRPLEGIRVLEVAAYISGPYAGSLLAALGADVVKIEAPGGDPFRIGQGTGSPYFTQYNAGKKSVVIDLKSDEGVALIHEMIPRFDVLIENMRPGKMDAMGLAADTCRAINPALVYASVSGFGNGGPWADRPAFDSIGQALGGFYTLMNDAGGVRLTGTCVADLITSLSTTLGILAGLVGRGAGSGTGVHMETSVFEAFSALTIDAMTQAMHADIDPVRETRHPQAQNFCLKTASGGYIVVHLSSSEKFWRALLAIVGREDMARDTRFATYPQRVDPSHFAMIRAILEEAFLKLPREEWERRLIEADVPFAPALTIREVLAHPQAQALGILGGEAAGHRLVNPPWRFDGARADRAPHVPEIGEDSRSVLAEFIDEARLGELIATGVVVAT